jgi:putative hydrolase of the HAD superfamily
LDPEQLEQVCQWDVEMWAHENPAMVEWAGQIRSHGMKTAILSNMHPDMVTYVRRSFAWIDSFDHHTFSAEVGLIKPEPAIYEHSLKGVGVEAREALFLDDREANVQAARDCGISAIQFQSLAQLREDLRKLSFPVLPSAGNPSPRLLP